MEPGKFMEFVADIGLLGHVDVLDGWIVWVQLSRERTFTQEEVARISDNAMDFFGTFGIRVVVSQDAVDSIKTLSDKELERIGLKRIEQGEKNGD